MPLTTPPSLRYSDPPTEAQRQAWHAEARSRARALREAALQRAFDAVTVRRPPAPCRPCLAEA